MLPATTNPAIAITPTDYSRAIKKTIRRYIRDEDMVQDISQDVLIKIWKNLPDFDHRKAGVYAWIVVITTNTCIDYLRSLRRVTIAQTKMKELSETVLIAPSDFYLRRELLALAEKLTPPQRDVVLMIYFKGFTQSETANLLNLPLGTVKSRQRSALQTLRKMLTPGA